MIGFLIAAVGIIVGLFIELGEKAEKKEKPKDESAK